MTREWRYSTQDTSDNSTTVETVPVLLKGFYVNTTLSAHTVVLKDDTAAVITIPASTAAGTKVLFDEGIRFETSLVIDPDDSSTGSVTLIYDPLEYR